MVLGLNINMWKRRLYGIRVEDSFLQAVGDFLCCKWVHLPFNFVGLIVGGNLRKISFWNLVNEGIMARLALLLWRLVSVGGRVELLNSVITNLPLYYMSFFKMSVKVEWDIIRIQRNFLWHNSEERKGIGWICWKSICKRKEEGGLRIKDVGLFNKALLSKWL